MRLIWYSTVPFAGVGYGVLTKELVTRMIKDGHEIVIATKHKLGGHLAVDGIECIDGTQVELINKIAIDDDYDYIITMFDNWAIKERFVRNVCCVLLDTEFMHPKLLESIQGAAYHIALTKHGEGELKRAGFNPIYAPLGVDTNFFRPDAEARKQFREKHGWTEDTFVVGTVGVNYSNDRKNLSNLIRAFQILHDKHPDTALYLHTDMMGSLHNGFPLMWMKRSCGFEDSDKAVQWCSQRLYHTFMIPPQDLFHSYNAFDVACFPHKGEGFGIPMVEAQACGVPIITSGTTSGPELCKDGWVIPIKDDYYHPTPLCAWICVTPPSAIAEQLENAYESWKDGTIKKRGENARAAMASDYQWDYVYETYWRPMLKDISRRKINVVSVPKYYDDVYPQWHGRIYGFFDCANVCTNPEACNHEFPLLDGETDFLRPILSRSYPLIPDTDGNVMVDTRCSCYKWLTPRFVRECREGWGKLFQYPRVRTELANLWKTLDPSVYVSLRSLPPVQFDADYKRIFQVKLHTTFQITDEFLEYLTPECSVLDVGCGDGLRVKALREHGYNAIGSEVNPEWINGETIVAGDALNLPFADNSFDVVMSVDVLEHVDDPIRALTELFRVAKKYVIAIVTPTEDGSMLEDPTHKVFWDMARWSRELSEFGTIVADLRGGGPRYVVEKK